jgi:hypothetical protein
MIYTVAKGGMNMLQALAAAANRPGADTIDVRVAKIAPFVVKDGNVTINGNGAEIDASGRPYGILVKAPWVGINDFEVFNSDAHGVVVQRTHHVALDGMRAHDNDGRGFYLQRSDYLTLTNSEADHNRIGGVSVHFAEKMPGAKLWAPIKIIGVDVHDNGLGGPGTEQQGILLDGKAQGRAGEWTSYAGRVLVQDATVYDNHATGLLNYGYSRVVVDSSEFYGNGWAKGGTWRTQVEARGGDHFEFRNSEVTADKAGYSVVLRSAERMAVVWDDNEFQWIGHPGEHGVIAVGAPQEMPAQADHMVAPDWLWFH